MFAWSRSCPTHSGGGDSCRPSSRPVLPAIVAIIILLIGSNVARAFSLAGAFSIIRFRSAPGDPKDIAFVLFTMAAGLACGVGSFDYAVLFTIALCALMFLLKAVKFGANRPTQKLLKVTIPENLGYEEAFDEVLRAKRWTFIESGVTHPRFQELLVEVTTPTQRERIGTALDELLAGPVAST